jgi:hypothetical protein
MNKKFIALLAGALLVAGMSGNAMASITNGDLFRVVYDTADNVEAIADLGSIATLEAATSGTVVGNGAASFLSNGITNLANSSVAYFSFQGNGTSGSLWVSGSTTTATVSAALKLSGSGPQLNTLQNTWAADTAASGNNYYQGTTTSAPSYYLTADKGKTTGSLDNFVKTGAQYTEANLANLATTAPQQALYYFANANASTTGVAVLTLQTNADGSTTIINGNTAATTPIPPAFFLMGSGLLGMFGLRRKKA